MTEYYLGIDQSLRSTGLCVLDGETHKPVYLTAIVTSHLRGAARLAYIRNELSFAAKKYPIQQAALEGYSFESVHRACDLGEVGGVIRLALFDWGIPYLVVAPASLKKFVTGNGAADKTKVMASIKTKWKIEIDQDDQADAYGLAQVARAFIKPRCLVSDRAELEVLNSLDSKPKTPPRQSKGRTKVSV